jgi:hypothetical protein
MIHQPASPQRRLAGRGIPRIRGRAASLIVAATPFLAGAPAALAEPRPDGEGGTPVIPPPPATAAAHFPVWGAIAIVAATGVLSVATTLVTLSLQRMRRYRRPAAATRRSARKPPPTRQNSRPDRAASSACLPHGVTSPH